MKYKGRKKYSQEDARKEIEIARIQIQNNLEEIQYWCTRDDPLILALVHMTREECIQQALDQIEYIESKIEYMRKFIIA